LSSHGRDHEYFVFTPPLGLLVGDGKDAQGNAGASPLAGYQFFGEVTIDVATKALTVELIDLNGVSQFSKTLAPQGA